MNREEIEEQTKQLNEELEIKLSEWEKQFSDTDKDFARVCFKKGVDWMYERNRAEIDELSNIAQQINHVWAMYATLQQETSKLRAENAYWGAKFSDLRKIILDE